MGPGLFIIKTLKLLGAFGRATDFHLTPLMETLKHHKSSEQ